MNVAAENKKNEIASLIAAYTDLLNKWSAEMKAGNTAKGHTTLNLIRDYQLVLSRDYGVQI